MENWKPVVGFEGYYEVSDLGRVRRVETYVNTGIKHSEKRRVDGKILKQKINRAGYCCVDLCANSKKKTVTVHQLVARAFLEKSEEQTEVNHKNCVKTDNRLSNLEWCTPRENKDHAKANDRYYNPNGKPVRCKQNGMVFESSYDAAEWINNTVFHGTKQVRAVANKIRCACLGRQKTAYGFTWERP